MIDQSHLIGTRWSARLKARYVPAGDYRVEVVGVYHDGAPAIRILSLEGGAPVATVTKCLSQYGHTPPVGWCYIKTWSENEGILETLVEKGIVSVAEQPDGEEPALFIGFGGEARAVLAKILPPEEVIR